jgi:hypothetical protein
LKKQPLLALAVLVVLALVCGWGFWLMKRGTGVHRMSPPEQAATPLNPHRFPALATCQSVALTDPAKEARANIAKGDLRPFAVYGFTQGNILGVYCPSRRYPLDYRGGTFVSDVPDACGHNVFSNAPPDRMEAYNRVLAVDPRFQKLTGCRPSTYCEERYGKVYFSAVKRDPRCPGIPLLLTRVAESGANADLVDALADFRDRSPKSRDAITSAFIAALSQAQWANAETLLRAGANINGRAFDTYPDKREWLGSPLPAVFNKNGDTAIQIARARWLFANGLTFTNPQAHQGLTLAAASNNVDAVTFLLARGASPNGPFSKEEMDRLAKGDIRSAGGGYGHGMTAFYAALDQAISNWSRETPEDRAYADAAELKARINAVTLYRAGGRFIVGKSYNLRQHPDIKAASILLAAAYREGRMADVIDRILYSSGPGRPAGSSGANEELALAIYLKTVKACPVIRPVPKSDHIKLCAKGDV